jgi:hypothetical protein
VTSLETSVTSTWWSIVVSLLGYVFPTREVRGEREREGEGERAHESKWPGSPSPSPWALFIGEVEMVVYILFHWWGEILQVGPQIFTTRALEALIKSLYL